MFNLSNVLWSAWSNTQVHVVILIVVRWNGRVIVRSNMVLYFTQMTSTHFSKILEKRQHI